jgi:hypothetical protein
MSSFARLDSLFGFAHGKVGWLSLHVSIRFVRLLCLSKLLSRKQNSLFPAYNFCSRFH